MRRNKLPIFNTGDKVKVVYHPDKNVTGKSGTIVYARRSLMSSTQPIEDKPSNEREILYIVKLDDDTILDGLRDEQLRKV
jgi:hypothetical protein